MGTTSIKDLILTQLDRLTLEQQQQVLAFTKQLDRGLPPAVAGTDFVIRARGAGFDSDSLTQMQQAIEEGCEGIDHNEW